MRCARATSASGPESMAPASFETTRWSEVPYGSFERHALSPVPRGEELGIGLAAPARCVAGERIPVAGFVALSGSDLLLPSPWARVLSFVAVSGDWLACVQWHAPG